MNRHVAMDPFTTTWWICILTVASIITTIILLPKYFNWASSKKYPKILAAILLYLFQWELILTACQWAFS